MCFPVDEPLLIILDTTPGPPTVRCIRKGCKETRQFANLDGLSSSDTQERVGLEVVPKPKRNELGHMCLVGPRTRSHQG